ncbi:MAG: iron-containing alcohol dehydrogenase [Pseudomonadota bacterium]
MTSLSLLDPQDWNFPVPIRYGPGRLGEMTQVCRTCGVNRPLLVTDRGSRDLPFVGGTAERLSQAGLACTVFSEISPNPRDDEVAAGKAAFQAGGHDGVLAIGGGSGMDGAKAICLVAHNEIPLLDFDFTKPPPAGSEDSAFPPLITVPTTAGTGAETEGASMITDTARMMKLCVAHEAIRPAATILDPEITRGLPRNLTAWTGCDALVHAIEAYCVPNFHPLCDGSALEGLRLIWRWLPTAVEQPDNLEARGGMLVGSCLAGIAFLNGLGLVHAISHMVGAEFDTHHGLTNAVVLPSVLRFNEASIRAKVGPMAEAMDLPDRSFATFYDAVCRRLDALKIPRTLTDIGVVDADAAGLAQKAMEDAAVETNPHPTTPAELEQLIREALDFGR